MDAASGAVVGATIGGWSCAAPGAAQFDGTYEINGLAVGHSYTFYAEALNGAVDPSQFDNATVRLLFLSPITNRIDNSIVRSEPAAAEDKPGTERG